MLAQIIVLYVGSAEVGSPTTTAMVRAVDVGLAGSSTAMVREAPDAAAAQGLTSACGDPQVAGAASVSWLSAEMLTATVLVRHCASGDESRFQLAFVPHDPAPERGRSLGFVIASALHASATPAVEPPAATPAISVARDVTSVVQGSPVARRGYSLDAFAIAGVALGGEGGGVGGGLAFRLPLRGLWGLRFGLQGRSGQIGVAQASLFEAGLAAGATRTLLPYRGGALPALGLRVDLGVSYESLTHFSSDDPEPVRRQRVFPAVDGRIELTWPWGPIDLQISGGVQAALATADIVVRGNKVAKIPPWRGIIEAGFRAEF